VEERAHFARRGREPRANPAAELLELTGGDLTLSPRHGVVMAERPVDALRVVRGEPGVVHARAQPREDAAGIVVAAVDARLVVRGCTQEQIAFALQDGDALAAFPQRQREAAAEEPATDHDRRHRLPSASPAHRLSSLCYI